MPSALPDVEDTIFPGQPKHAPSSLRGKRQAGRCSGQKWEHVAGEVRRELGRAGLEEHSGNSAGKDWAVAAGQGRCGRSCESLEMQAPRTPVQGPLSPCCPFCVSAILNVQEKRPTKLPGLFLRLPGPWNAFFGNGHFSQAPKPTQNPQNYNRTVRRLPGNGKTKVGWEEQKIRILISLAHSEHALPPSQLRAKGLKALSGRSRNLGAFWRAAFSGYAPWTRPSAEGSFLADAAFWSCT